MTTTTEKNGRLGNQIIRNMAVSFIAEKHNLFVKYSNSDAIQRLGIPLFVGKNTHNNTSLLTDDNFFDILNASAINSNLDPNPNYFQTKEITNYIYKYLKTPEIQSQIINKNPFKIQYNANNNLFIHIRLTDTVRNNPGLQYYTKAIANISCDNIFISTDDPNHPMIKQILQRFPNTRIINLDEIQTFQFGSTCKHIILSHGSFSAIIGYLAFYSDVYYPQYEEGKVWYGDMFSIPEWKKITF